jgi:hypothetical protein
MERLCALQSFGLLADAIAAEAKRKAAGGVPDGFSENWLPFLDTDRTMCVAPEAGFKRVLEQASACGA